MLRRSPAPWQARCGRRGSFPPLHDGFAEGSGVVGLALRRWRRQSEAAEFMQPTAATTRWRVSALPSTPLPVPGVGRARWRLELVRCRRGESAEFEVEACDAQGRLALPAEIGHGRLLHVDFFT